jgi:hypothetical protein
MTDVKNNNRGFIPDVRTHPTGYIDRNLTRAGHSLFELLLQKQGTTRPPCLFLDFICFYEHHFRFSRICNPSSPRCKWPRRMALAFCYRRWYHWLHWNRFMVRWNHKTYMFDLTHPGFTFHLRRLKPRAMAWRAFFVERTGGSQRERKSLWSLVSYVMILGNRLCITWVLPLYPARSCFIRKADMAAETSSLPTLLVGEPFGLRYVRSVAKFILQHVWHI